MVREMGWATPSPLGSKFLKKQLNSGKESRLCHKLKYSNSFIFSTLWNLLYFKLRLLNKTHSFTYVRVRHWVATCKDIGISKIRYS